MAASRPNQSNGVSCIATVTNVRRSWDWSPWAAGKRAVRKHADALRRLAEGGAASDERRGDASR